MSMAELQDLRARVEDLERNTRAPEASPGMVPLPMTVAVKNTSGLDIILGDWVQNAGLDTSGALLVQRPAGNSATNIVGVAVQNIPTGEAGKIQTAGLAQAYVTGLTSPSSGAPIGSQSGVFFATPTQTGAGRFVQWIRKTSSLAWVLIGPTDLPLRVEHADVQGPNTASTDVIEAGKVGELRDVWKVRETEDEDAGSTVKVMNSISRQEHHNEGWVWGDVISEYGNPGFGWAPFGDVLGLEANNLTTLNILTTARYNDAFGKVGPIAFDLNQDNLSRGQGPYVAGFMKYQNGAWYPAIKMETIRRHDCTPDDTRTITGDCDCNCLDDPQAYQFFIPKVHGPYRNSDSLDNYIDIICCLIDRVNLLFRLVHVMDCCYGNKLQALDNFLSTSLTGGGPSDIVTVLQCVVNQVFTNHAVQCAPSGINAYGNELACSDPPYDEPDYKQPCKNL